MSSDAARGAPPRTPAVTSRLPQVGTTIFSVMSALAAERGAVNLGQGFPDFDGDPALPAHVADAMREGLNQYPPMAGVAPLRRAVADKIAALYGARYDADAEITVTAGATQAILTAVLALVHPGDEVLLLEPCYDSYAPAVALAGAHAVGVPLRLRDGRFEPDLDAIAAALSARTRLLIINTPHNPGASVWRADELDALAELLRPTEVLLLSDEVYEHMVFDGQAHASASAQAELAARSLVVSSFGKTFHVTGWKVGTVAGPAALMAEFRKVHQFNVFTVNTPMQHGLARYLADDQPYRQLPAFYQRKRDHFREALARTRFQLLPCAGSYFQCVDYSAISSLDEQAFCHWLTCEVGVSAIPLSAFYADRRNQGLVRLCFAKRDDTLQLALQRLARL